jgi:hypothetical protein
VSDRRREANPLGGWLIHLHPLAFVAGVSVALVLYALLLRLAPANVARVLCFVILFGHAVGASTWLVRDRGGAAGYLLAALLLLAASRVLGYCWQQRETLAA